MDIAPTAPAPHLFSGASAPLLHPEALPPLRPHRAWRPKRVLVTRSARAFPRALAMAERAAALGAEVVELPNDRLTGLATGESPAADYRLAKATLAVVVASAAKRRLQPIPPSADWRFDLAEGCPAHCQYCYLAGSLAGPPDHPRLCQRRGDLRRPRRLRRPGDDHPAPRPNARARARPSRLPATPTRSASST